MHYLFTIAIATALSLLSVFGAYNYAPFNIDKLPIEDNMLGASVTEISGSDTMSDFPTTYNANLNSLNDNKMEMSTTSVDSITTLNNLTTAGSLTTVGTIGAGVWQGTDIGVAYGGTGASTFTAFAVLLGNGASAINTVSGLGTSGQSLVSNGAGSAPTWQSVGVNESSNFNWTGLHDFAATTTMATTTVSDLSVNNVNLDELLDGSTTTLHKHDIAESIEGVEILASDLLIVSADTERNTTSDSYVKIKEIVSPMVGTYRIKFDLKSNGAGTADGRIYKNGSPFGTEQGESGTSYVTYSEDLDFAKGDLMQLYLKSSLSGQIKFAENFRIYGTLTLETATVNTD